MNVTKNVTINGLTIQDLGESHRDPRLPDPQRRRGVAPRRGRDRLLHRADGRGRPRRTERLPQGSRVASAPRRSADGAYEVPFDRDVDDLLLPRRLPSIERTIVVAASDERQGRVRRVREHRRRPDRLGVLPDRDLLGATRLDRQDHEEGGDRRGDQARIAEHDQRRPAVGSLRRRVGDVLDVFARAPKLRMPAMAKAAQKCRRTCSRLTIAPARIGKTTSRASGGAPTTTRATAIDAGQTQLEQREASPPGDLDGPMLQAPGRYGPPWSRYSICTVTPFAWVAGRVADGPRRLPGMMRQFPVPPPVGRPRGGRVRLLVLPATVVAHAELETSTPEGRRHRRGHPGRDRRHVLRGDERRRQLAPAPRRRRTVVARGGVDPDDDKRMVITDLPELAPGTYTVRSTTKSAEDGDIDRKEWSFTVDRRPDPESESDADPDARTERRRRRRPPTPAPSLDTRADGRADPDRQPPTARTPDRRRQRRPAADHRRRSPSSPSSRGYLYSRRDTTTHPTPGMTRGRRGAVPSPGSARSSRSRSACRPSLPATVLGHALNATYTSRLPLAVYLAGAAMTVALSFIFVLARDVRADATADDGAGALPPRRCASACVPSACSAGPGSSPRGSSAARVPDGRDAVPVGLRLGRRGDASRRSSGRSGTSSTRSRRSTTSAPRSLRRLGHPRPGRRPTTRPRLGRWPAVIGFACVRLARARRCRRRPVDAVHRPRRLHRVHAGDDGPVRARHVALATARRSRSGSGCSAGSPRSRLVDEDGRVRRRPFAQRPARAGLDDRGRRRSSRSGVGSILFDGLSQTQTWFDLFGAPGRRRRDACCCSASSG